VLIFSVYGVVFLSFLSSFCVLCPILPIMSSNCPFVIASSVFSSVYVLRFSLQLLKLIYESNRRKKNSLVTMIFFIVPNCFCFFDCSYIYNVYVICQSKLFFSLEFPQLSFNLHTGCTKTTLWPMEL
jgi:hypothetical protein